MQANKDFTVLHLLSNETGAAEGTGDGGGVPARGKLRQGMGFQRGLPATQRQLQVQPLASWAT